MVNSVTNFSRNGVSDWLVQRISAVILGVYFIGLLAYLVLNPELEFAQWKELFSTTWMRIATLLALLSLCAHAWIGMWTVYTDYLTEMTLGKAATAVRIAVQTGTVLVIFIYLVWGIQILWGN